MNAISVYNISKTIKDDFLFSNVSFGLDVGERLGIVGKNGAGKSTFLKIIARTLEPDTGKITINNNCRVAYLEQDIHFEKDCTLESFLLTGNDPHVKLLRDFQDGHHETFEEIENLGLWNMEDHYKSYLGELGVKEPLDKLMSQLSGGTQKKAAIARILAIEPNILLLDEPTNHLDIPAIEWLESKLTTGAFTLLLVTHDRYFLDKICTKTMELDDKKAFFYEGGYTSFTEHKAERLNALQKEQDRLATILRRELEWLHRGPQARTGKDSGRKQRIEEMKSLQRRPEEEQRDFSSITRRLGKKILELKNVSAKRGDKTLIQNLTLEFVKGMRIGVIGPNGSGKTTLLDLITGHLEACSGEVDTGVNTAFGYYDQKSAKLPLNKTMLEYISEIGENIQISQGFSVSAARFLELFGFPSSFHRLPISVLSGGEKRRLYLLATLVGNPNFLVLDEPTNDLDIDTLCRLEQYITDFQGCVLAVSHDRAFLDKICSELIIMPGATRFEGNYTDYKAYETEQENQVKQAKIETNKVAKAPQTMSHSKKKGLNFNQKKEFEAISAKIEELEDLKAELEEFFSSGKADSQGEKAKEYSKTTAQLQELYARWEELAELA